VTRMDAVFKACKECPWDWLCESKEECEAPNFDPNPDAPEAGIDACDPDAGVEEY